MGNSCSVSISLDADLLTARCVCGWCVTLQIKVGRESENVSCLIGQHINADGLLVELANLIGPYRGKKMPPAVAGGV